MTTWISDADVDVRDKLLSVVLNEPAEEWFKPGALELFATYRNEYATWAKIRWTLAKERGIDLIAFERAVDEYIQVAAVPEPVELGSLLAKPIPPKRWFVENTLPMSGWSAIVGDPKTGKSSLVRWLMYLTTRKGDSKFAGRKVAHGPVVYYVLEEIENEVVDAFRTMGYDDTCKTIMLRIGRFPRGVFIRTLVRDVERFSALSVVVDPIFDVLGVRDLNSYTEVNDALKEVVAVVRSLPCHLIAVHHTNKSTEATGGRRILGSQAIAGATDANLVLRQSNTQSKRRVLESDVRYGKKLPDLFVDKDERTGHIRFINKP